MRAFLRLQHRIAADEGSATVEYALVTMAAVAIGGILIKIVTSETVKTELTHVFVRAIS